MNNLITIQTDHFVNKAVTTCFSRGTNSTLVNINDYVHNNKNIIATYGILRGTENVIKKTKNFFYLDHGYLSSSKRQFNKDHTLIENLEGYFRIVNNDLIGFEIKNHDEDRIKTLDLKFLPKRTKGEYIILSEPSEVVSRYFNLENWLENTTNIINKFTDRKIYIHNKFSKIPLDQLLKKAWAFVSFHSTAGFKSMIQGVPAHFTHNELKKINSLENIENGEIDYNVFKSLSYNQWTLREIHDGAMNHQYGF